MAERLIVTVDHRHFKVLRAEKPLGQTTTSLTLVDAVELVDGRGSYASKTTDMAGRFPGSKGPIPGGMSIDERLPLKGELDRRIVEQIAMRIDAVLGERPEARWDFAAGPGLHQAVLERVSPAIKQRLNHAVQKDLTNIPTQELVEHFESAQARA
jgi:hypothetical protein